MAEKIDAEALQFGQMLQRYRESAKVTQQEIADATGLTKNYISSIERGVHKCNAQTFIIYAKKCGVSLDEMAGLVPKSKLNRKLIQKLSEMNDYNNTPYCHNLYNGKYELFATDGSDFNMPYQSKSKYAMKAPTGRPKINGEPYKPFSQMHGNMLFRIYAELLGYTRPIVSGRADKRNMKPKSAVWFVYRVA